MGEHSVVYGRPALVAALGLRARVDLDGGTGDGVSLLLDDLGLRQSATWTDLDARARGERRAWREYAAEPDRVPFRGLSGGPAALARVALGEVAAELGHDLPPIRLRVRSQIPVGSGLGSSAAVSVALLAAVLAFLEGEVDGDRLERLALEVERRQHGLPSGVDHRTVLAGGVLRYEPGPPPRLAPVAAGGLLGRLQLFDTGPPAESTGEVVAAVRRERSRLAARFEVLLERMADAVGGLERQLVQPHEEPAATAALFRGFEECLEELGVVPEPVRRRIRAVERLGAAAKVCGAGALTGESAGSLLVYHPPEGADPAPSLAGLTRHGVELGADGWRLEEAA